MRLVREIPNAGAHFDRPHLRDVSPFLQAEVELRRNAEEIEGDRCAIDVDGGPGSVLPLNGSSDDNLASGHVDNCGEVASSQFLRPGVEAGGDCDRELLGHDPNIQPLARTIYDSAVRRNLQPLWSLPILVAGKFTDEHWRMAAEAAGCVVPDQDGKKATVEEIKRMVAA